MQQPNLTIDTTFHAREYEDLHHLDFESFTPTIIEPVDPNSLLAELATKVTEVIAGIRPVDQLVNLLNDHVYESLRRRVALRSQNRLTKGRNPKVQPTEVLKVRFQSPAQGVIESVVIISNRERCRAVAIRLEEFHTRWRATNIGFL